MLAPHRSSGRLRVLLRHTPVAADIDGDRVSAVMLRDLENGGEVTVAADWVIDATETGDLLPLCGVEHITGAEAASETGEPHGAPVAQPGNVQPVTVCFALDHTEGADFTIDRPAEYDRFH
jgi:FAD dependent oxidoreductase